MRQMSKTVRTKRALSAVAMATLWLAGLAGGAGALAADAPAAATNKPAAAAAVADETVVLDGNSVWRHFVVLSLIHI